MTSPKLLSVNDAAEKLQLSSVRVRQFCQEGRLGRKIGNIWVIDEKELDKFSTVKRPHGAAGHKK